MTHRSGSMRVARCSCGECRLLLEGTPIMTAICYCESCQNVGHIFERLSGAPPVLGEDGGTAYVLQRKDRISFETGVETLREHRLKPKSSTRRIVAACCNSPMFLEFSGGHWLSVYRDRIPPEDRPAVEMRTMTADRPDGVEFRDTLPSYRKHSGRFMLRLLAAWVAMGFRAPKLNQIRGTLDV